jgi:hypothetical protein
MKAIIWSSEGKQTALDSTEAGFPALCGVDLLLQRKLHNEYRHDPAIESLQLPLIVGSEVANVMRELGYTETRRAKCPEGCVAKTGLKWKPKD